MQPKYINRNLEMVGNISELKIKIKSGKK